jgi:hypothetical protein
VQILRRPQRILVCEDVAWGGERLMFITADWQLEQAKQRAKATLLRPLYIVNLKPKGIEYA